MNALYGIDGHTVLAIWLVIAAVWLAVRFAPRDTICESCGHAPATLEIEYTDGILFAVCADCAPIHTESRR